MHIRLLLTSDQNPTLDTLRAPVLAAEFDLAGNLNVDTLIFNQGRRRK